MTAPATAGGAGPGPAGTPTAAPAAAYDASYLPQRRTVLLLISCRAAFRGLWLAAPLLLATTWSTSELAVTVTAIGGFGWLTILLASTEKTVLKHAPRLARLAGQVSRSTVVAVGIPLVAGLVVALPLTAAGSDSAVWAWGLVWAATGGLLQAIAALHRLDHRAGVDALVFGGGAGWLATVTTATILFGWAPIPWLVGCISGLLVIAACGLWAVRARLTGVRRRAARRPIARSFLMLGLPEVLSLASVSAGYWALAATSAGAEGGEATRYYVAVTVAGVAGAFVGYTVRLQQPDISLRAKREGADVVLAEARRWLDRALVTGIVVAAATLLAWLLGASGPLILAGLTLGEIVVYTQRTIAVNRFENASAKRLPINAAAAGAGLLTACVVLIVFAEGAGALAAMAALVVAQVVNAAVLRTTSRGRIVLVPSQRTSGESS